MRKESIQIQSFKGLNRQFDPTQIDPSEFYIFENADLRRITDTLEGRGNIICKRNGYGRTNSNQLDGSTPISSIYEHIANGTKYLIGKSDNGSSSVIKHLTSYALGSWTSIATGETAGRLNFTSLKNNLYIANRNAGANVNKVWRVSDSAYVDHGCMPPWSATMGGTSQSVTGGGMSPNPVSYAITFLYDSGQESKAIMYKTVTVSGGHNSMKLTSIPIGNSRVIARRIYRTPASSVTFEFVDEIRNNTQTEYDDVKSDDELTSVFETNDDLFFNLSKPKRAKVQCEHRGRLWQGNITEDLLNPLSASDITIAPNSTGSGSLSTGVDYTYRIYKSILSVKSPTEGYDVIYSQYVDITPTQLTGVEDSYTFDFNSTIRSDPWFKYVAIYRKDPGSTNFELISNNIGGTSHSLNAPWHAPTDGTHIDTGASYFASPGPKPVYAETNTTSFPGNITYSEADRPDLFPSGNEIPLGDNDGQAITAMFSETNGLIVFKERSIWKVYTGEPNTRFWTAEKLVDGIGADEALQLPNGGYIFTTTKTTPKAGILFYYWDGTGDPKIVSGRVQPLIENAVFSVNGMAYDRQTDRVNILVWTGSTMQILLYDLTLDAWFLHKNGTTDLNLFSVCGTQTAGLLFGNGTGRVYNEKDSIPYDSLGATPSNVDFKFSIRTKTFTVPRGTLKIRRLRCLVDVIGPGASAAFLFKYSVDDASPTSLTTQLVNGTNQIAHSLGSAEGRKFYLQIDYTEGLRIFILKIEADINIKHEHRG